MRVSLCLRKKAYRKPNREPESAPDARTLLDRADVAHSAWIDRGPDACLVLRQARTCSRTCLRGSASRLALSSEIRSACGGRRDFCHPNPLARKTATKRTPLAADKPPRDSWSGRYGEPAGRNRSRWLMFSQRALSKTLQDPEKGQAARSRLPSTAPTDAGIDPQRSTDASTAGSEHACRRACPTASAPGLPPGSESRPACRG